MNLIGEHSGFTVSEELSMSFDEQENASITYDSWAIGEHSLKLEITDADGRLLKSINLGVFDLSPALSVPSIELDPTDRFQWQDSDEDGFGDVSMGAKRDDCPDVAGTSTRDLQGCLDSDGDGWSDEYGGWNAAISVMGENPATSWLAYLSLGVVMLISSGLAMVLRSSRTIGALEKDVPSVEGGDSNA